MAIQDHKEVIWMSLLFALTIGILLLMIKGRTASKHKVFGSIPLSLSNVLLTFSFLQVLGIWLMVVLIGIFGNNISSNNPLSVVLQFVAVFYGQIITIFTIFGTLYIMFKEHNKPQRRAFDSASIILVNDLLFLSVLWAWSYGKTLILLNIILILFLIIKNQHYKYPFIAVLILSIYFAYWIW